MSDEERYGTRDLAYSRWHRIASISRFVEADVARSLTMIDLDGLEYCERCRECVGVIEVARDVGQITKSSIVTRKLAVRLGVPGLLVFYRPVGNDIDRFRVRMIAPTRTSEQLLAPAQYAQWIVRIHARCACRIAPAWPEPMPPDARARRPVSWVGAVVERTS